MRGDGTQESWMFSYISPEGRIPQDHPLRAIREMADRIWSAKPAAFEVYSWDQNDEPCVEL